MVGINKTKKYGFGSKKVPYTTSVSLTKKRKKDYDNTVKYLTEQENKRLIKEDEESTKNSNQYKSFLISENIKRQEARRNKTPEIKRNQKQQAQKLTEEVMSLLFAHIVYESLPIDKKYKSNSENLDLIYNEAIDVYKGCIATVTNSPYFKNIEQNVNVSLLREPKVSEWPEGTAEKIVSKLVADNTSDTQAMSDIISDKVVDAVHNESLVSDSRISHKNAKLYFEDNNTLYRTIFNHHISSLLNESLDSSYNEDDIKDIASAHAMIDYTIIETINTSKLLSFDTTNIRKNIKHIK